MNTIAPNIVQLLAGNSSDIKVQWEHKQAKLVSSNKEISLLEALPQLQKSSSRKDLFAKSAEEDAKIYQWVEYASGLRDISSEQTEGILKDLNKSLQDRSYLTGFRLTVADAVVFYAVYSLVAKLTFYEKERFINLSRWYNTLQNTCVKMSLLEVKFSRTKLY